MPLLSLVNIYYCGRRTSVMSMHLIDKSTAPGEKRGCSNVSILYIPAKKIILGLTFSDRRYEILFYDDVSAVTRRRKRVGPIPDSINFCY